MAAVRCGGLMPMWERVGDCGRPAPGPAGSTFASDRDERRRNLCELRRLVLGLSAALLAAGSVAAAHGATPTPRPVVYGYPYSSRCPVAGVAEVVDRWGMYACNCTSYVAWALVANGQRIDWFVPGAMDAWNWPHVARLSGYVVDRRPTVGAVAVWPKVARPFGHVAYVTAVRAGGTIDVAEYNLPSFGEETFIFDTRTSIGTAGAVFIHVPRRERT
jgi:surface antigen